MKILGILSLLVGETLTLLVLWTVWFGKGRKDSIAGIILFLPCLVMVMVGWWAIDLKHWWILIPVILLTYDSIKKLKE